MQIKIRDSKYGPALVIQTLETGGGYTLGFRVDPTTRLIDIYKELDSLFTVYSVTPTFGVTYEQKNVKILEYANSAEILPIHAFLFYFVGSART